MKNMEIKEIFLNKWKLFRISSMEDSSIDRILEILWNLYKKKYSGSYCLCYIYITHDVSVLYVVAIAIFKVKLSLKTQIWEIGKNFGFCKWYILEICPSGSSLSN